MSSGGSEWGCSGVGQCRKGLGRGDELALDDPALRDRPFLDREDRLARQAIEQEDVAHLRRLGERRATFAPGARGCS